MHCASMCTIVERFQSAHYEASKRTFQFAQFDETFTSKRKKKRGGRVRQQGPQWLATAVEVLVPNRQGPVLKGPIVHLAAEGVEARTDSHRSYAAMGDTVRPAADDGTHTNHVEATHGCNEKAPAPTVLAGGR